jgi:hypothetical protein
LVLTASFGLSASTWIALARLAGFTTTLTIPTTGVTLAMAWLMPVCVDGYVVVALVLWMAPVPATVARFAKRNTYGAAGVSIMAQSAYHLLFTLSAHQQVWRVVLAAIVGAVPPAFAGLAVHMRALIRRESNATTTTATVPRSTVGRATGPAGTTGRPAPTTPPSTVDDPSTLATTTETYPAPVPAPTPVPVPVPGRLVVPSPAVVAARITPPAPATRPVAPATVPGGTARPVRARTGTPKTSPALLAPPATDSSVTAPGAAQLSLPLVSPALLGRAQDVARQYRSEHGVPITPARLAVRLGVSSDQATHLLEALDTQPDPAPPTVTVNGNRPSGVTR